MLSFSRLSLFSLTIGTLFLFSPWAAFGEGAELSGGAEGEQELSKTIEETIQKTKELAQKVVEKAKKDKAKATEPADKGGEKKAAGGAPRAFKASAPAALPKLDEDGGRGLRVVVMPIRGTIDLGLPPFVARVLAEAEGAKALILDVDTFGGRVDGAVQIRDAILASKVPTIAYVNRRAISAGAVISLAADHVVFAPGGSLGAATPVQLEGGQAKAVGEKTVSYMRSEMRATAEAKGRNGDVAEAMVDADIAVEGVSDEGKLLTLSAQRAEEIGLATAIVSDLPTLIKDLGLESAKIERPELNWGEQVSRFLTDPVVSGLLMSIGMLGLLLELYSPGFGLAGAFGISCLTLFFGGHMAAHLAGWEELLLFVFGLIALGVEVFVLPGFGVAGIVGLLLIGTSLAMAMVGVPIDVAWDSGVMEGALSMVVISLVCTAIGSIFLLKFLPGSFAGRWLVLDTQLGGTTDGSLSDSGEKWAFGSEDKRNYVGLTGFAATDLRPAGKMQLGEEVIDVVSRDTYLQRGTPVKVVSVEGIRVVVVRSA